MVIPPRFALQGMSLCASRCYTLPQKKNNWRYMIMDQAATGKFITKKRKELNLTQEQIVEMMKEMQDLKNAKITFTGYILMIVGIVMLTLSQLFGGTEFQDFLSGFMLGLSICQMVIGIFIVSRQMANKNRNK